MVGDVNGDIIATKGGEKRASKIDLKNVKMAPFSGLVPTGAYDSGVRDWWEQFSDQLEGAQRKRAAETYQEYADRLLQMSDGLTGDIANSANVQNALGTFLRLAWPQRKDIVQAHVRGKRGTPDSILNDAVAFLCELVQSDGRLDDYKRRKTAGGSRTVRVEAKPWIFELVERRTEVCSNINTDVLL
ncbi:unnamed protein product [Phytophthora fragariaefolia]|uniref:Unnamed protein product n=1 Tax=Phytophthora fragariaefolia TaxID=1490495 RepID=A0A9W6XT95_9STRA|nr:unnamed protein product [Phytophthora fragariaefolia]